MKKVTLWLIEDDKCLRPMFARRLKEAFGDIMDVKTFSYVRDTKNASSRPEYIIMDISTLDFPETMFGRLADCEYAEVLRFLRKYIANYKSAAVFFYSMINAYAEDVAEDIKEACEEEGTAVTQIDAGKYGELEKALTPYMEAEREHAKKERST